MYFLARLLAWCLPDLRYNTVRKPASNRLLRPVESRLSSVECLEHESLVPVARGAQLLASQKVHVTRSQDVDDTSNTQVRIQPVMFLESDERGLVYVRHAGHHPSRVSQFGNSLDSVYMWAQAGVCVCEVVAVIV